MLVWCLRDRKVGRKNEQREGESAPSVNKEQEDTIVPHRLLNLHTYSGLKAAKKRKKKKEKLSIKNQLEPTGDLIRKWEKE